ncbi:MAG: SDR family oxidoreductase [Cyclobacteriaceae bacterium]
MGNKDKLVVVTGGSKGIGRAIIEQFAKDGFTIATCSRNKDDLQELKDYIENKYESVIHHNLADLSKRADVDEFIEFVKNIDKPVEVLVNNAGRFVPGEIHNEPDGILEDLINTNLYSAYHVTRGIVPSMKERKTGYVFNICSTASITAYANGGSYCISKFAMYGMSKVLREELKPHGIKVTSVMPGATLTASWEGADIPNERFVKAEDVAAMVFSTFMLSDRAVVEDLVIRPQLGDL